MTIPTISTLPTAPARTDPPATFISRADSFLGALVTMQGELNTSIGSMNTDIAQVNTDATAAAASATAAANASNASVWVSGTTYALGDVVYSPTDYQSYRRIVAGAGTTDPSIDATNWTKISAEPLPSQTGNAGNYLTTDGTDASWAAISAGKLEFTASGSLANGELVSLGADGKVSSFVSGTQSSGAFNNFNASDTNQARIAYDTANNKIVISYVDQDFSSYGAAVVGSVSGITITGYGTKVIYKSATIAQNDICYDSTNEKMVITTMAGNAYVGTVSGNSISFGPELNFSTGAGNVHSLYIPSINKVALIYSISTTVYMHLATVSGTSMSFGARVSTGLKDTNYNFTLAYNTAEGTLLGGAKNDNISGYPSVVLAVISGSTFSSMGTPTAIGSSTTQFVQVEYIPTQGVFLASAYSNPLMVFPSTGVTVGSITNTTFSANPIPEGSVYSPLADTTTIFYNSSGTEMRNYTITVNSDRTCSIVQPPNFTMGCTLLFNTELGFCLLSEGRIGLAYGDNVTSGYGQLYQATYDTYSSFIGISDAAYADGATATVQVVGAVDDAQSGLITGNKYYVSSSGGLTQSAASGVYVGAAISSTEILIKG